MKPHTPKDILAEKVAAAMAIARASSGLRPYQVIDDLVGLDTYRHHAHCPDMELLAAFAEDRLPLEEAMQIASHERRCPLCRADAQDLRATLRQPANSHASLPVWNTPFVGRELVRDHVETLLQSGNASVLTLTAPAGMGKTRLALEVAEEQSHRFPDGVWYVPLAAAGREETVASIVHAVGLPLGARSAPVGQLREFFSGKQGLLLLDNVEERGVMNDVLREFMRPDDALRCLMTSPQVTMAGETTIALPPLPAGFSGGGDSRGPGGEDLRLFLACARESNRGYRLSDEEMQNVASLCVRAGGIPLAIELAAARSGEFSPDEILHSLQRAHPGEPVSPLRDLLDWSYHELSEREQRFLRQITVFEGGIALARAEEICEEPEAESLAESLCRKSLLVRLDTGRSRFVMLSPVREYAARRLAERGGEVRERHTRLFLRFAQEHAARLEGQEQLTAVQEMTEELPNLRAGMRYATEQGEAMRSAHYGLALNRVLMLVGQWPECATSLRTAVESAQNSGEVRLKAEAQIALARCQTLRGEYAEAKQLLRDLQAESRQDSSPVDPHEKEIREAEALRCLGNLSQLCGEYAEAEKLLEEARTRFEGLGERWRVADCLQNLGFAAWEQHDYARAETLLRQSLPLQQERGDRYRLGATFSILGNIAYEQGRMEEAREFFAQSLQVREEVGDVRGSASALTNMGMIWYAQKDYARADYAYSRARRTLERLGDWRTVGQVCVRQGELAEAENDSVRAVLHLDTALRLLEAAQDTRGLDEIREMRERIKAQEEAPTGLDAE